MREMPIPGEVRETITTTQQHSSESQSQEPEELGTLPARWLEAAEAAASGLRQEYGHIQALVVDSNRDSRNETLETLNRMLTQVNHTPPLPGYRNHAMSSCPRLVLDDLVRYPEVNLLIIRVGPYDRASEVNWQLDRITEFVGSERDVAVVLVNNDCSPENSDDLRKLQESQPLLKAVIASKDIASRAIDPALLSVLPEGRELFRI